MCAVPTTSTTPTFGFAIFVNFAMSPECLAPISKIQNLVCSLQRKRVSGTPISVFKFPAVATVSPSSLRIEFKNSFVVVLPCEPVIPTIFNSGNFDRRWIAKSINALPVSLTNTCGSATGLLTKANLDPRLIASVTKSCPSTCSPLKATKNEFFVAFFELITGT